MSDREEKGAEKGWKGVVLKTSLTKEYGGV